MKEIKLTIDGKEVALTADQIKALGIEVDDGCVCDRVKQEEFYWYIDTYGRAEKACDLGWDSDLKRFLAGNYYRSESYAKQVALHQMLNNLLRRYSEQHGGDCEWDGLNNHYRVDWNCFDKIYIVKEVRWNKCCAVPYFGSKKYALDYIEEVVKPFLAKHPEFVW